MGGIIITTTTTIRTKKNLQQVIPAHASQIWVLALEGHQYDERGSAVAGAGV